MSRHFNGFARFLSGRNRGREQIIYAAPEARRHPKANVN